MGMPPFLKKLGLKKPGTDNNKEEDSPNTAVIIQENDHQASAVAQADDTCKVGEEKELTETEKLLKQVKEAGTAGFVSYA